MKKSECIFKRGDIIRLNSVGLKNPALVPANLVLENRCPNRFTVWHIRNFDVEIFPYGTVSLEECCNKKVPFLTSCTGHPAENFELVDKP